MTSAASPLSLRLVTSQLREQKVFKYLLEFSDPGDWSLCFCLSSPWNPLDVLPLHTCRRRWGPDMMCGYYVLRCCVRTRSQGDKRQINHVSPPTLCFSPPQRLFFLFFFKSMHQFWVSHTVQTYLDASSHEMQNSAWKIKWQRHRAADRAGAIFGSTWFSCRLTLLPVTPCLYCETMKSASPKSADAAVPYLFECIWLTPHTHTSTQSLFKCGRALNLGKHFLQSGRSHEALSRMDLYTSSQPFLQHGPVSQVKARYRVVDRIPQG